MVTLLSAAAKAIESLPSVAEPCVDFRDTSYFRASRDGVGQQLLLPQDVIKKWEQDGQPKVARYPDLGIAVKVGWAPEVSTGEALTMRFVRLIYSNGEVPVPEVFGWRQVREEQGHRVLIYMSLIQGETLKRMWPSLNTEDKESICAQLKDILSFLRSIQRPYKGVVGSISKSRVRDRFLQDYEDAGPFPDVRSFNDHIQLMALPRVPVAERPPEPFRSMLPDQNTICLTHGDVSLGNIMITGEPGKLYISAILDLEQSGWYPEYWEYCEMHLSMSCEHEWRAGGWVEKIITPYEDGFDALCQYWSWRGYP